MLLRVIRGPIAAGLMPLLALNGCYAYLPVERPSPQEGTEVRIELAGPGSFAVGEETYFNIGTIDGETVRSDDDSLLGVSTTWLRSWRGGERFWTSGAFLFIPYDQIDVVQERRFSAGDTLLGAGLAALGVAAVVGIVALLRGGLGGSSGLGGGEEF